MKKIFILILLVTVYLGAFTQNKEVSGKITGQKGKALSGVKILEKDFENAVYSDENGQYSIRLLGEDGILIFSKEEYQTVEFISSSENFDIELKLLSELQLVDFTLEQLLNIEISTASKKEQKISDIPASIVLITRREIELYGFKSLSDIFRNIAGLYYMNNYSFLGPTLGVRGYMTPNASNLMVLVNGMPQHDDLFNSFSFYMSAVPVEAIDRIEVVRGPMSVIYGSNAFFGAINIITNETTNENSFSTTVSSSFGSTERGRVAVSSEGKEGNFSYNLSAMTQNDIGIDYPISDMNSTFSTNYQTLGFTTPDKTTEDYFPVKQKYFGFSGTFNEIFFSLSYNYSLFGHTFTDIFYQPALMKLSFASAALAYNKEFSHKFSLHTKINYNNYYLYLADNYYTASETGFGYESDNYSYGEYFSERVDAEVNLFFQPIEKLNISVGTSLGTILQSLDKTDAPYNPAAFGLINRSGGLVEDDNVYIFSAYSQFDFRPSEKLQFVAGARVDRMSTFDLILYRGMYTTNRQKYLETFDYSNFYFIPRLAAIVDISKGHVLKLMYGKAIKLPDIWSLRNNLVIPEGSPLQKKLDEEQITTLELNYMASFSSKLSVNMSLFYNTLDNLVSRTVQLEPPYTSYFSNMDKISTKGFELSFTATPNSLISGEISVTYQESTNEVDNSLDVDFSPNWLGYFKAAVKPTEKLSFSLVANYVSEMYAQWDKTPKNTTTDLTPKGRVGENSPAYFLLGANVRFQNLLSKNSEKGLFVELKASNILDSEIRYPSTTVSKWANKGVLGYGRNFLFTVGYEF
jgi:outer membrane receptor protein involved in Fe transport